jgi:hypothetical protein
MTRPTVFGSCSLLVAGQTPSHFVRCCAWSVRHCIDHTMAIRATETRIEVHFMGEIHEIRKPLQSHPFNGSLLVPVGKELS